jgi:hypothetical protein
VVVNKVLGHTRNLVKIQDDNTTRKNERWSELKQAPGVFNTALDKNNERRDRRVTVEQETGDVFSFFLRYVSVAKSQKADQGLAADRDPREQGQTRRNSRHDECLVFREQR